MTIVLQIPGEPAAQPRAKATVIRNKAGGMVTHNGRAVVRMYTKNTADDWKRRIHFIALKHRPPQVFNGAVKVDITAYFSRPQRLLKASSPKGAVPHTGKPDKDNIEKAILDAIKGAGMWKDDAQVFSGTTTKLYAAIGFEPGARIEITFMEDVVEPTPLFQ